MANIINWDENPLAQELEKERAVSVQLIKQRDEARAEVERLKAELAQAISERTPHDYGILKYEIECLKQTVSDARIENSGQAAEIERLNEEYRVAHLERQHYKRSADHRQKELCALVSRPDPCRLEIAAMLLGAQPPPQAGSFSGQAEHALRRADALIAAAKEVAK